MPNPEPTLEEQTYRIGAVSRITGVSVDTLRIWERRYNVVTPERQQGSHRLYNSAQINRLSMLKTLIDRGDSIGRIANLSLEELSQRLYLMRQFKNPANDSTVGQAATAVAIYGQFLPLQITEDDNTCHYAFSVSSQSMPEFETAIRETEAGIVVLEYPTIQASTIEEITRLHAISQASKIIVIYGFTTEKLLNKLSEKVQICVQAPVSLDGLLEIMDSFSKQQHASHSSLSVNTDRAPQKRLYSNAQLNQLISKANVVGCECPQHLVSIIKKLVAFEIYSNECENLDDKDAQLHKYLGNISGQARFMVEQALAHVVEHDE